MEHPDRKETCADHGDYVSVNVFAGHADMAMRPIWSRCPICDREKKERAQAEKVRAEKLERERRVQGILYHSGIPARFTNKDFAGYEAKHPGQSTALKSCKAFASRWADVSAKGTSLVLTGGPGTGKTHLACAIGCAIAESNLASTVFVTVSEMLRTIKATYHRESERTEAEAIAIFAHNPDLLIVDEIGVQVGSDHEKLLLFEVLNARYANMMPTILISNLSAGDLEAYLGHRVMDRFRECGTVIAFDWASHRGTA